MDIVKKLESLGERQGKTAIEAGEYLMAYLKSKKVAFSVEPIETELPTAKSKLVADGKAVESMPASFVGGTISGNSAITSSLISSKYLIDVPNINFNPKSETVSRSNFYFAPSVAVRATDISTIVKAKKVSAEVKVTKKKYGLSQILVGNAINPKTIIFSHYDSIGPGALDNASGTAVCLSLACSNPELLQDALFVFDPNEELSYDYPTYWGGGYRVFEERYGDLLAQARSVVVVDCVGNGPVQEIRDPKILKLAFPLWNMKAIKGDVVTLGSNIEKLMEIYHSDADTSDLIEEKYLEEAKSIVKKLIKQTMLK